MSIPGYVTLPVRLMDIGNNNRRGPHEVVVFEINETNEGINE